MIHNGTTQLFTSTAVAPISFAGDYNNSGVAGSVDYVVWCNTLGQTGLGLTVDGTMKLGNIRAFSKHLKKFVLKRYI